MLLKARVLLLGLATIVLAVSVSAETACAEPGPFLRVRESGVKTVGSSVGEGDPEIVRGKGGEQKLKSKVSGTEVEISIKETQIKGILYDNGLRGQAKLEQKDSEPKLAKPEIKGCITKIGENNTTNLNGHLAWTWNGEEKQLEEENPKSQKPDWVFFSGELEEGATELPKGTFTVVTFSSCGVLTGKFVVRGSEIGEIKPEATEEWGTTQAIKLAEGKGKQHLWTGKKSIGVETGLIFGKEPAVLGGEIKIEALEEALAVFGDVKFRAAEEVKVKAANPAGTDHRFVVGGEIIECKKVKWTEGVIPRETTEVIFKPVYEECTNSNAVAATVAPGNCKWRLGTIIPITLYPVPPTEVACGPLVITRGGCQVSIAGQIMPDYRIEYSPAGGGAVEVGIRWVRGFLYSATGCPENGASLRTGEYKGHLIAEGENAGGVKKTIEVR